MRVALNLEQLLQPAPGGIGRYSAALQRLLPACRPPVEPVPFVALHPGASVSAAMRQAGLDGLRPAVLPLPRPLLYDTWHVLGAPGLGRLARGLRGVDLVHATSVAVPPTGRTPLVVTVHDVAPVLYPETFNSRGRFFHKRGLAAAERHADVVITPSEAAAAEITEHTAIRRDRIRVVHNGVTKVDVQPDEVDRVRRRHGLGDDPYIFWVGTLEPRKNLPTLLAAFRQVVTEDPSLPHRLVLGGPAGWGDAGVPDDAGADERVRLLGRVAESDLAPLYAGADLFAFPSRHEGFGLPVLEAMAQGTPVVCSDIPALAEISGGLALLVPPDDTAAWAAALHQTLTDPIVHERLVDDGIARATAMSWERSVDATSAVYRELV